MKIGDLVIFDPTGSPAGSLTAVKYFARYRMRYNGKTGIVVYMNGDEATVLFGKELKKMRKIYLKLI